MEYEKILERCLEKVPDDLDKREGSFMYTALAPLCFEIANMYCEMQNMLDLSYIETAYGEFLDKVSKVFGLTRNEQIKNQKIAKIVTDDDIISQKFNYDEYIFIVLEKLNSDEYIIEANDYSTEYNDVFGELKSIMNLTTINSAEILSNYVLASNTEEDEHFRSRVIDRIYSKPFGGNISDYQEKILEVSGVSFANVFTAYELDAGHVHIIIAGENKEAIDADICNNCEILFNGDENNIGIAPIGHNVTISSCTKKEIEISIDVLLSSTANETKILSDIKENISLYINDIDFSESVISIMKIATIVLLDTDAIDTSNILINGSPYNLELSKKYDLFEVCDVKNITINLI